MTAQGQDRERHPPKKRRVPVSVVEQAEPAADEAVVSPPGAEAAEPAVSAQSDGAHAGDTEEPDPQAADAPDAARQVEGDLDELLAKAQERDEYLALAQRTQADFENYRRRMTRDMAAAESRGVAKAARELLPALDNLERALAAANEHPEEGLAEGVRLLHSEVTNALGRLGIEAFRPEGEQFDPEQHEAMASQAAEAQAGTIVEVYQQGYRLGGTVIRPARVVVAA
jgi:molecular chaperone GrpE